MTIQSARYLSVRQFCIAVGISRSFFYTLRKRGKIEYRTQGRRVFIPVEQVERWGYVQRPEEPRERAQGKASTAASCRA